MRATHRREWNGEGPSPILARRPRSSVLPGPMREPRVIVVVDYGMGNIRSVLNACEALGAAAKASASPADLIEARGLILPGVGAFGDGMAGLRARGLDDAVTRLAREQGRPLLGICLGMQLLAARGTEHGEHAGLGLLGGTVTRLPDRTPDGAPLRLPHVGWNTVRFETPCAMSVGIGTEADFYFVHSYSFAAEDPGVVAGRCTYGRPFTAAIEAGPTWGMQFHPEKSHHAGLGLLRNWLERTATW